MSRLVALLDKFAKAVWRRIVPLFTEHMLKTAFIGFISIAIFAALVRGLHYDFGKTAHQDLIVEARYPEVASKAGRISPMPSATPFLTHCKPLYKNSSQRVDRCVVVRRVGTAQVTPSPPTPTPYLLEGYVTRPNCRVTLYADQAPVDRVIFTPPPHSTVAIPTPSPTPSGTPSSDDIMAAIKSGREYAFKFEVAQSLWGTQKQIVADCEHFPRVTRGVVWVTPSPSPSPQSKKVPSALTIQSIPGTPDPALFAGVGRAIHFWISPGRTRFYGVIELSGDDPRLNGALGLSSLEQLARESFNVNFNFHPLYDALGTPVLGVYKYGHHRFLTLKGDFESYATVAGASNISIVVAPIELVRADSMPTPSSSPSPTPTPSPGSQVQSSSGRPDQCTQGEKWCSKIVVQFRGFNAMSFPDEDPNGFSQSLGPPAQINRDGSYVWYAPVALSRSESVQISVRPYPLVTPVDVHHFFAAEAKVADPLIGALVNILHSLVGVAIVVVLLYYAGFWRHEDNRNERYCGVLVAAAFASATIGAGVWLARCGFYLGLYAGVGSYHALLGYLLWWLKWAFVVGILGAAVCALLIVLALKRRDVMRRSRYFWEVSVAIFSISLLGTIYSLFEVLYRYKALYDPTNLNSHYLTIFSDALLAIVLFATLMIAFQPHLALQLFQSKQAAQRWTFWIVVVLFVLSASVVFPSSAYFSADYAAPEFRIDTALTELGPYISSLAVVIPILWCLVTEKCDIDWAAQNRWHLAWIFAVLAILTGYSYLGFPVTLLLTVLAVNYIVLRPPDDYALVATNLGRPRDELLADAESIYRTRAAEMAKGRLFQQFLSGTYDRAEHDKRLKGFDKVVAENKPRAEEGQRLDAVALAFGIGLDPARGLWENARLCAFVAAAPGALLTILAGQSFIANLPAVHGPFLAGFVQVFDSILGYMAAGMGFGLAYPYIRGNIGTVKALWIVLALCLAIVPYEFMSGSRSDYFAQALRWIVFFGTLGLIIDVQSILNRGLNFRDFFNMAGIRNFAAVGAVAATILTSLVTSESRELLEIAIHYAVPAQYALPTSGAASAAQGLP